MNERELFEQVLETVADKYNITIERPYHDTYIVLRRDNTELGSMNYGGYNILRNIGELHYICKFLLS